MCCAGFGTMEWLQILPNFNAWFWQSDQEYVLEIDKKPIPATSTVKLLGITIASRLKFSEDIKALCTKANNRSTSTFSCFRVFAFSRFHVFTFS